MTHLAGDRVDARGPTPYLAVAYGLGLALTSATQLRMAPLPVGPGELLLVAWFVVTAVVSIGRGTIVVNDASRAVVIFWSAAMTLLAAGTLVAISIDRFEAAQLYDFFAFLLSALTTVMFVLQPELRRRCSIVIDTLLVIVGSTQFLFAVLLAAGVRYLGPIDTFYEGARFQGWTNNPNQLAFVLLSLPLFALHRLGMQRRLSRRIFFLILALLPVFPGALCFSNALFFAWTAALSILGVVAWMRGAIDPEPRFFVRATRIILVPLAAVSLALLFGDRVFDLAVTGLDKGYNYGDHGSERMNRWRFGVEAALNSPFVGLGPGSFSGPYQPFGGGEAHNTLIDWGSSTGVLGDLALVGLLGFAAFMSVRNGAASGVAIIVAIFIFSSFHYILRQPVFWFDILAVASFGLFDTSPRTARQVARRPSIPHAP